MRMTFLAAAAAVLLSGPAMADNSDGIDCNNAMTQMAMNICADRDYQATDRKLNDTYRALMAMLDDRQRQNLVAAERAWIGFRDAHCRSETQESEGGSIHPMMYSSCLTDMTKARIKELQASLACQRHGEKCYD